MFPNSEADYYFARERAARALASHARDPAARCSHLAMAAEYRRRAFACGESAPNKVGPPAGEGAPVAH